MMMLDVDYKLRLSNLAKPKKRHDIILRWSHMVSKAQWYHTKNKATFVILRHPVTTLVTAFINPDNLTYHNNFMICN